MTSNLRALLLLVAAAVACTGQSRNASSADAASTDAASKVTNSIGTKHSQIDAADTTLQIVLERGPCHGRCPVYRVSVYGNGRVTFVGRQWVDSLGTRTHVVAPAAVRALINAINATPFSSVNTAFTMGSTACGQYISDLPMATLSVKIGDVMRRVYRDPGCEKAPRFLKTLEAKVDDVTETAMWAAYTKAGAE